MLEFLKVILLGIVEGITEWLPISSTGHMIILDEIIHLNVSEEFMTMFRVVIQLGAILAVVVLHWNRIWPFRFREAKQNGGTFYKKDRIILWCKILVSCVPAVIFGLLLDDWLDEHLYTYPVVALMLIIYGVLFLVVENRNRGRKASIRKAEAIGYKEALIVGGFQVLSLIPGTSRSGATILGGISIGMSRRAAAEYSFFLGIPVMFGASFLKILKFGFHYTALEAAYLIVGMAVAFVVSIFVIRGIIGYIRRHNFKIFGLYRIVLGIIVLLFFLLRR